MRLESPFFIHRPECSLQFNLTRYYISGGASVNGSNRKHSGIVRIIISADDLLQTCDEMRGNQNRIDAKMRSGRVTALALNGEVKFIGAGHDFAGTKAHLANLQSRMHMQSEDCRRFRVFEHTFFDEEACTSGVLLFAGLENQFHCSLPLLPQ